MSHKTKGTKEWAPRSLNCYYGCSNNCVYCYAKDIAYRFKRIEEYEEWKEMKPNMRVIEKGYREVNHISKWDYMFPTSHDITPKNIEVCIIVLKKVLIANNTILITTKADYDCIIQLVEELESYKDQVEFRITLTSISDDTIEKYEPNAPPIKSRVDSLRLLCNLDYDISISCEPYLDADPIPLLTVLHTSLKDSLNSFWIGIMSGRVPDNLKLIYSKDNVRRIYEKCKDLPKRLREIIRFKDSIVNMLKLGGNTLE